MTISRMLAAMLATAALIAPVATAQPVDMHQSTAEAAARELKKQDLRMPDQRDPAAKPLPGAPRAWAAYPSPFVAPAPVEPVPAQPVADDGTDWAAIGIGAGLGVLAFVAIAGASRRSSGRRERIAT